MFEKELESLTRDAIIEIRNRLDEASIRDLVTVVSTATKVLQSQDRDKDKPSEKVGLSAQATKLMIARGKSSRNEDS